MVGAPTIWSAPPAARSVAGEALEVAASCGLVPDPWQVFVLERALGVRDDGKWAAFEVGIDVSRQNGKGGILEVIELGGLFCWGDRLIIHSAHEFATSMEAFLRMEQLLEEGGFSSEIRSVSRSHGSEGFVLRDGRRLRYRTRTKGGGRGFTGDTLVLDEAMILPQATIGALLPTLSARPNPHVVYTGSAVDQLVHDEGVVFAKARERGHRGDDSLAWFEWSAAGVDDLPGSPEVEELLADREAWARANPALGIRISEEHVENERRSMDARTFAVERLGVGDWPDTDPEGRTVIPLGVWDELADPGSIALDPVWFAYDVSPDRSSSSIAVVGKRPDGLAHLEVLDQKAGTGWVADALAGYTSRHRNLGVYCDGKSPAASLVPELLDLRVKVETLNYQDMAAACGMLFDAVEQGSVRHLADSVLRAAIRSAAQRPLGDAWAWARKKSSADITPLVAVTVGHWALRTGRRQSVYETREAVVVV